MNRGEDDRDRVRAAANLVEQFAAITKVKRSGRSYTALCPFHQEKTPSLSIDPGRGLFYCFGCHKGGDVFTLIQETQGLSFPDALQSLARQAGIVLTHRPGDGAKAADRERLVHVMGRAVDFYTKRLLSGADAGPARAYLRSRGYDRPLIEKFGLGFSPLGEPSLKTELRSAGISDSVMERAGLAVRRGRSGSDELRDRFWGRIMFPIHDLRGDPVGFGARLLSGQGPKYLNSPETPLYHKSRLLYGLHLARREISRSGGQAVVVEGYTDVIALHQAGMESAVATCGTALGEDHLEVLGRLGERIVLAFDADRAGSDAVLRGERVSRRSGRRLDLRVAELPDGKDPADLVQDDRLEDLRQAVSDSRPVLQYRMERRLSGVDLTDPRVPRPGSERVERAGGSGGGSGHESRVRTDLVAYDGGGPLRDRGRGASGGGKSGGGWSGRFPGAFVPGSGSAFESGDGGGTGASESGAGQPPGSEGTGGGRHVIWRGPLPPGLRGDRSRLEGYTDRPAHADCLAGGGFVGRGDRVRDSLLAR